MRGASSRAARRSRRRSSPRTRRSANFATCRSPSASRCVASLIEAIVADTAQVAEELTWQIGRPLRYSPGEMRGFAERARYMIDVAPEALADLEVGPERGVPPLHPPRAARRRARAVAVELPVPDLGERGRAGARRRQRGDAQALRIKRRSSPSATPRLARKAGLPEGVLQHIHVTHEDVAGMIGDRARRLRGVHRLGRGRSRGHARGERALHRPRASSSAARIRRTCAPTPTSTTRSRTWSTGVLQLRPVVLRDRAHLRAPRRIRRVPGRLRRADQAIRARQPAQPRDHARTARAHARRGLRARPGRARRSRTGARADRRAHVPAERGRARRTSRRRF